jgi:hypothetical protein
MADHNQPYDPYIPAGGNNGSSGQGGNSRTAALQAVGEFLSVRDVSGIFPIIIVLTLQTTCTWVESTQDLPV